MDQTRFDDLARALGAGATRRAGLKAALGALLGVGGAAAAVRSGDARKKRCKGGCPDGQACRNGVCVCPDDREPCGGACCGAGEECRSGTCVASQCPTIELDAPACFWMNCEDFDGACCWVTEGGVPASTAAQCQALDSCEEYGGGLSDGGCYKWADSDSTAILPPWPACLAKDSACKDAGAPCCAGLTCASGQGGSAPSCLVPAGGRCAATSDCVFGAQCLMGLCTAIVPQTCVPFGSACVDGVDICCAGACGGTLGFQARDIDPVRAWKCCVGYGGLANGEPCDGNAFCCSGHCCVDNRNGSRGARRASYCSATACQDG